MAVGSVSKVWLVYKATVPLSTFIATQPNESILIFVGSGLDFSPSSINLFPVDLPVEVSALDFPRFIVLS